LQRIEPIIHIVPQQMNPFGDSA